jgi:hypothetical protein
MLTPDENAIPAKARDYKGKVDKPLAAAPAN